MLRPIEADPDEDEAPASSPPAFPLSPFLPLFSAALTILTFPNFNNALLAWVALVPLSYAILVEKSPRPFLTGWLTGALAYSGILYWLIVTFQAAHQSIALGLVCLIALSAYLGLFWGAWTWFLSRLRGGSLAIVFGGAAAWAALEFLRTFLFSGFPWALLADSQYLHPFVIQIASLTGAYGVGFLIVAFNLTIALVSDPARRTQKRLWIAAPALVAASCLFGIYRLSEAAPAPSQTIPVALLQGSIDQYKKWSPAYVTEIEQTYRDLAIKASQQKPKIIVWPETSIPGYLMQDPPLWQWLQSVIRPTGAYHLIGAPMLHADRHVYNAGCVLSPQGVLEGEYGKIHLVPFGEVVPWASVLGRFVGVLNELGGFTAGTASPVLAVDGCRIGVNVCYEAIFPQIARRSVRMGGQVIANLTNDGWYMRTAAPYQHFAPNILRAVENDRWVMRADNTGISALIDPRGRIVKASPIFVSCYITGTIEPRDTLTLYTRLGDWFAWLCAAFCLGICLRDILRFRHPPR